MQGEPSPLVLITRPESAALPLKRKLEARGYATIVEPLLTIEHLRRLPPLSKWVQALALTSVNAVPALSDEAKRLPIFTVGKATAEAARQAGCSEVIAGDGDGGALAGLISEHCDVKDGAILHVSGEIVRDGLDQGLKEQGFEVRREMVYRALASGGFSNELSKVWRGREVAAVLLFSPRTAEILVRLLNDAQLSRYVDRTVAICVSEATATPCRTLDWRTVVLAAQPNQDALIRALEGSIRIC
ncbi:MAG: uroporphyrinogen-III synthase [Pseudomonadota bacterium]